MFQPSMIFTGAPQFCMMGPTGVMHFQVPVMIMPQQGPYGIPAPPPGLTTHSNGIQQSQPQGKLVM